MRREKYSMSSNRCCFEVNKGKYNIQIERIDFEQSVIAFRVTNLIDTSIQIYISPVSMDDNVTLCRFSHVASEVENTVECNPKDSAEICIPAPRMKDALDFGLMVSIGVDEKSSTREVTTFGLEFCYEHNYVTVCTEDSLVSDVNLGNLLPKEDKTMNEGKKTKGTFAVNEVDFNEHLYNTIQKAEAGDLNAVKDACNLLLRIQKDERGLKYARILAKNSDVEGSFFLGWAYKEGFGCKRDLKKAEKELEKCVDLDCAGEWYYSLAGDYLLQIGNELSIEEGIKLHKRRKKCRILALIVALLAAFVAAVMMHESVIDKQGCHATSSLDTSNYERIYPGSISASSSLVASSGYTYAPEYILDDDLSTTWQEGDDGDGTGCTIEIQLPYGTEFDVIELWNGQVALEENYYANNRVHEMTITVDGHKYAAELQDYCGAQFIVFDKLVEVDSISFVIDSAYLGTEYNDLNISEIKIWNSKQ